MTLPALRDMLHEDGGVWCQLGRVELHDGEQKQWEVMAEGSIMISVKTHNDQAPIWALLACGYADQSGIWKIPPVGTEVLIHFPDGEFSGDPTIVGFIGKAPQNLLENITHIIDQAVQIRSAGGTAKGLAFWDDLNSAVNALTTLITKYKVHTHPDPVSGFTGAPVDTAITDPNTPVATTVLTAE